MIVKKYFNNIFKKRDYLAMNQQNIHTNFLFSPSYPHFFNPFTLEEESFSFLIYYISKIHVSLRYLWFWILAKSPSPKVNIPSKGTNQPFEFISECVWHGIGKVILRTLFPTKYLSLESLVRTENTSIQFKNLRHSLSHEQILISLQNIFPSGILCQPDRLILQHNRNSWLWMRSSLTQIFCVCLSGGCFIPCLH
jgi:hypothetical protein